MNGLLKTQGLKAALVLITSFLAFTASAQQSKKCISHNDISEIGKVYPQIELFVKNKPQYCESDLGPKWHSIINALVVLKNISPNEPSTDNDDAFTYKAIVENDWWSYFTRRADRFTIRKGGGGGWCRKGTVAFVIPSDRGNIHLCPPFFEDNTSSQASTLMHEVRHFDGHRHVVCTRGADIGRAGACDDQITRRGSYAISVQTLVGMARSKHVDLLDKPLLESEALYLAFNRFNEVPRLKLKSSILLSNKFGEVYRWSIGAGVKLLKTLNQPAIIHNSYQQITLFPVDRNIAAYRMGQNLITKIENPGAFAARYNEDSAVERAQYQSFSYFGTGGFLHKDNSLSTICNDLSLSTYSLDQYGQFINIVSLSLDEIDAERDSFLVSNEGKLMSYGCDDEILTSEVNFMDLSSSKLDVTDSGLKLSGQAKNILTSFGLAGEQYALLKDGRLTSLSLKKSEFKVQNLELPIANQDWISAAPMSKPEIF